MAIENEYPPAAAGLILAGDVAALRRQLAECEAHLADVEGDLARVRQAAADGIQESRVRYAQTGNPDWLIRQAVHEAYAALIKPVE